MGNVLVKEETLTQIADAIREKAVAVILIDQEKCRKLFWKFPHIVARGQTRINRFDFMIHMENWFTVILLRKYLK